MTRNLIPLAIVAIAALVEAAPGAPAGPTMQDPDGRRLYLKNCRQCHGATGVPSAETKRKYPKIKSLHDSAFVASLSDDSILVVMRKGAGKGMKSFSDRLTPTEMNAVVQYVRTLPTQKAGAR